MEIKIKKLHPGAKMPAYATADAACFDLHAATVAECQHIGSVVHEGYPITCETGLAFEIPQGNVMLIFGRSGHGFKDNVRLSNCVGVIDADYRGGVKVKLTCDIDPPDDKPGFFVKPGDRIAQALVLPVERVNFIFADELSDTERGTGGFGSTGKDRTMTEKDYSLLRPFDLDAAKAGAKLFCINSKNGETECTFIQKAGDELCIHFERYGFSIHDETESLRMAPLCWVEGKPVYPGDVLERENWKAFIPDMVAISGELRMSGEGLPSYLKPEQLRWPRPKPVKRWVNIRNLARTDSITWSRKKYST